MNDRHQIRVAGRQLNQMGEASDGQKALAVFLTRTTTVTRTDFEPRQFALRRRREYK